MSTYPGSFAGHLICRPDPEIDYIACQDVVVSVQQNNQILATKSIKNIDTVGQFFELLFDYAEQTGNIQFIIDTCHANDQFNRDNPVEIDQLIIDDLFTMPHFLMSGMLMHSNQLVDTGNVLWRSGQLVYTFKLPIVSGVGIVKTEKVDVNVMTELL
jgi:hypothetical protein